jgi:hypothetical protein
MLIKSHVLSDYKLNIIDRVLTDNTAAKKTTKNKTKQLKNKQTNKNKNKKPQNNSKTNKQTNNNKNKKLQTNQKPQLIGLHRIVKHIVFQYLICLNKFIILVPILVFIPSYFMVYNNITESRTGNQVYCVLVDVSY